jgi:hypothetical protein
MFDSTSQSIGKIILLNNTMQFCWKLEVSFEQKSNPFRLISHLVLNLDIGTFLQWHFIVKARGSYSFCGTCKIKGYFWYAMKY